MDKAEARSTVYRNRTARGKVEGKDRDTQFEILKTVIDRLPVSLFIKSGRPEDFGTFLFVNKMHEEILGLKAKDMIGKSDHDFFPKEQADFFTEVDQQAFRDRTLVKVSEEPIDTMSGRIHLHTRKFPIFDKEGKPDYLIGISQDITERVFYEESIRLHERNLSIIVSTAERLIAEGDWRDVIQDALRELGLVNGYQSTWLFGVEPRPNGIREINVIRHWWQRDEKPQLNLRIDARPIRLQTERMQRGELAQLLLEDAHPVARRIMEQRNVTSIMGAPVMARGELWGIFGMASSEPGHRWTDGEQETIKTLASVLASYLAREQIDEELKLAESRLRHASQMEALGQLAGGIAHDFNNMLTSILGFSQLAIDQLDPGHPAKKDLGEVLHVGQQAAQLSRQMLVLSRKHEVEIVPTDLCDAVRGFDRVFRRPLTANFELITVLGEPCWIQANREQLELVIMNLAINARDAMPRGGNITVSVQKRILDEDTPAEFQPGPYAELVVRDNGPGIPTELQQRIFEPFFTTKQTDKGTGLGLSTTHQVVQEYGGFLRLESTPGTGSAFHLYFPLCEAPAQSQTIAKDNRVAQAGEESILIVEDEATLRNLTQRILERLGYQVQALSSGTEAYSYLLKQRPALDLILCDVVMPHMSGPEMIRRLEEKGLHYPVLYMSGYTGNNIDQQGFRIEGCQLLAKPFNRLELAGKIREALAETANQN